MEQTISQLELMKQSRSKTSFDAKKLAEIIYGSKKDLERTMNAFHRVEKAMGANNNSRLPSTYGDINRQDMLLQGLRSAKLTFEDDVDNNSDVFQYKTYSFTLANASPIGISPFLFTPFLKLQASDEQLAYWLPLAESGRIIGCYAQTELGHGTHVGGIETTATFDKETDEFVIHSPTLSSTKYWPGSLGFNASHAILMARLVINSADYGIHAFMVQLRSLDDFAPMRGIELGDIGFKMSYNDTDNGFAVFDHVRIPRTNLLSRHSTVSRDGEYATTPLRKKLVYGGMLNGRSIIVHTSAFQLAQALTITTRYSVVRTQGTKLSPSGFGTPIIQYKQQHYRLLPLIAKSYAILFASKASNEIFTDVSQRQKQGDHSTLPYIHMLMCGLKAWSTQTAADGAEEARKMCGGQGYMAISGLPDIVASVTAACTFEGENFVIWDQVGKYLMKGMDSSALPADMAYMENYHKSAAPCLALGAKFLDHGVILGIFQHRAAALTYEAHTLIEAEEAKGNSRAAAEDAHSIPLLCASRAHIEVFIFKACTRQLSLLPSSTPKTILSVLGSLVSLFGLSTIASPCSPYSATFLTSASLTGSHVEQMRRTIDDLLTGLLPEAIALTDAWSFTDASLRSAIGCWDGDAYRRIMEWTRQLPINVEARRNNGVFKEGWEQVTREFLRGRSEVRAKL